MYIQSCTYMKIKTPNFINVLFSSLPLMTPPSCGPFPPSLPFLTPPYISQPLPLLISLPHTPHLPSDICRGLLASSRKMVRCHQTYCCDGTHFAVACIYMQLKNILMTHKNVKCSQTPNICTVTQTHLCRRQALTRYYTEKYILEHESTRPSIIVGGVCLVIYMICMVPVLLLN